MKQCFDSLLGDGFGADIAAPDLHDAGLFSAADGQDRAEIKVVRKEHVVMQRRIGKNLEIARVWLADLRPVLGWQPR